jgi:hypothetical protein
VTEVRRGRSSVFDEALPGPRTWKASWATCEANRATGVAWRWLEGAGHGGWGLGGLVGGGAACSRPSPVNFGSGKTESARGGTAEALGYFIGTTRCTGGRRPSRARRRAWLGASAWTGVNRACQPQSNTWSRCFCPCSNADWAQIFVNLGKIVMKNLFPWLCFVVCVWMLHGFRLGIGSCNVAKLPVSDNRVPRTSCVKIVSNGFCLSKLHQSMFKEIWRHFDIWTLWIRVLENREHIWTWERVLKFRILISEFSHRALVHGMIWGFWKIQMAKLPYYIFRLFSALKLCYLIHTKILYFSQVFSQFPFMCLNGSLRII